MKVKLEILTTKFGCSKCERAMKIIDKVIQKYEGKVNVIKTDISDTPDKLVALGVMSTPAILINGKVVFEGSPSEKELDMKIKEAS